MSIVTVKAGDTEMAPEITHPGDAILFAQVWAENPARVLDLINVTVTGEDGLACEQVRLALWHHLVSYGNCSRDTLNGLLHIVGNLDWLASAPHIHSVSRLQCPAIAIGSGPSLARDLNRLRDLQGSCLLVCSDSAAPGLMAQGIHPHVVTPLERDHAMDGLVPGKGAAVYAGTAVVRPEVTHRFQRHIAVPSRDILGEWVDRTGLHVGGSTGTMAVAVACELTDGPVHLVGHDLCWEGESHWTGSTAARVHPNTTVIGNDGKAHPTFHWFLAFRDHIAQTAYATRRVYDEGALIGTGAFIPNVTPASLPEPGRRIAPQFDGGQPSEYRASLFQRAFALPGVLMAAVDRARQAMTWEQLSTPALCGEEAAPVISALLRPIFVQASLERRLGMNDSDSLTGMRQATCNVLSCAAQEVQAIL